MKDKIIKLVKRYKIFILLLSINIAAIVLFPSMGRKAFQLTGSNMLEM